MLVLRRLNDALSMISYLRMYKLRAIGIGMVDGHEQQRKARSILAAEVRLDGKS